MPSARDCALKIVAGLDAARRVSSFERPVDELALIEAAIADVISDLEMEITARDADIAALKSLYERSGRKGLFAEKRAKARDMLERGLSYREIAARLGYKSPSIVHRMLKSSD